MRPIFFLMLSVQTVLASPLTGQDASPTGLPVTSDTVMWGGGCTTCNERFENGTRWRQVWIGGQDSLAIFAALYPDPDYVLVGIYTANLAQKSILFDPNRITLGVRKTGEEGWTSYRPWTRAEVSARLAKRYKKDRQSQQLLGVLAALSGRRTTTESQATAIASDGRTVRAYGSSSSWQATDVSQYSARIDQLKASEATAQRHIQSVVLAEQTLDPGTMVLGLVAFERQKKADTFVFEISVSRSSAIIAMPPLPTK